MSTEAKQALFEKYVENLETAVKIIDVLEDVLPSFNGKVYNARFQKTLQEKLKEAGYNNVYLKIDLDNYRMYIKLSFWNNAREVYTQEKYNDGTPYRQVHYLPDSLEDVSIAYNYSDYNRYYSEKNEKFFSKNDSYFWIDGKNLRLNTEAIRQAMEERRKTLEKDIENLKYASTVHEGFNETLIEAWQKEAERLKKELEELNSTIPCSIKSIFGIKTYGTYC